MGYNYNYYYYHSSIPYSPKVREEVARAELRHMAMDLVWSQHSLLNRLGCRLVGDLSSMKSAAKKGHRRLMRLVHPDKNGGSVKSDLATKELQKLLEAVPLYRVLGSGVPPKGNVGT